ncbi:hypothetical protein HHJ79_11840 [Mobiluncus mulieris]|nr:hypothetical protein [Mobiluncus mulieris]
MSKLFGLSGLDFSCFSGLVLAGVAGCGVVSGFMRRWPGWRAWPLPWLLGVTSPGKS